MRESFRFSPNILISSVAGRIMLKPSLILRYISPRMKLVISGVQAEACGPLEMAVFNACSNHGGPVCVRVTSYI